MDENEEPDDSSSSRNPNSVLKRPLDQHHLGCINLGQSVLVRGVGNERNLVHLVEKSVEIKLKS